MKEFFQNFSTYISLARFDTVSFWAFPICTIIFIWLISTLGLKVFTKRKKLKTVFIIYRAWIVSSLIAAAILISLICFWWSKNFFSQHPYQLTLLISLIISLVIPIIFLLKLRNLYTSENIKEITDQPKTINQLDSTISFTKKVFRNNKLFYLIPTVGFLFLLFYLNKGTNLISIVFDNSGSMTQTNAIDALSETFDNLQENNEIILTTLNGPNYKPNSNVQLSVDNLMQVSKSSQIFAGNVLPFVKPIEAKNGLNQISGFQCCSPICESIWKTFLFIKETKANQDFRKKLLIIITDGMDDLEATINSGKFFFNNEEFVTMFPPENVFVIDFSQGTSTAFMQRFQREGCDIYPAENNKQDYLDALDNALKTFKNSWFLIVWTVFIFILLTMIALFIQPKKIM